MRLSRGSGIAARRRFPDSSILVTAAAALLYGSFALWLLPPEVFWSGDAGVKYVQAASLVRQNFESLSLIYPGETVDPNGEFFPFAPPFAYRQDGRFLAGFPPAFAALTSLPYALFGARGLCVIPFVSALAVLLVLRGLCLSIGLGEARTLAAVSITAFASPLPFYGMVFWEHSLFTLLVLAAIALVVPGRNPRPGAWMASGILLGLATALRTEGYVVAAAVILVTGVRRLSGSRGEAAAIGPLMAGLLATLAPLWVFNFAAYGAVLGVHARQILESDLSLPGRVREQAAIASALFLDRRDGLLFHCPWVALAPLVMMTRHPSRESMLFLLAVALIALAGIAAGVPNAGGVQWGPRYLLPILPITAISAVEAVRAGSSSRRPWMRATLLAFLIVPAARPAMAGPVALYERLVGIELPALEALRASPVQVCVFRNPWFGQGMASAWFEKEEFRVRYQADVESLMARLFLAGRRKFLFSNYSSTPFFYEAILLSAGESRREVFARRTGSVVRGVYLFEEWTMTSPDDPAPLHARDSGR